MTIIKPIIESKDSMNNIEKIGNLGKGSFAEVYLVRNKLDNQIYAMKQIILSKIPKSEQESALNEVRILASIEHPNIIDFKEVFINESDKSLNIIMEYASDKDLLSKIKYYKVMSKNIAEETIWDYLIQLIFGLKILHDKKIIHRDLKSANIFISGNIIKIGDFNISKVLKNNFIISSQTGTPYYASPEVWSEKPYDYRTDIWSLGCIIYELCCFRPPFLGTTADELYRNVLKGKYEPIPKIYSNDLSSIIGKMLTVNFEKRPDTLKLLSDPIILQKIDNFTNKINYYGNHQDIEMLNTIKFSFCLNELNKNLPKLKRYNVKSRSDNKLSTYKNDLAFEHHLNEKINTNQINVKMNLITPSSNNSDSTSASSNNEKIIEVKNVLEGNVLDLVNSENKNTTKCVIPQSNTKIRNILNKRRLVDPHSSIPIEKIKSKERENNKEIIKKVSVENIDLIYLENENKGIKKENKIIGKPAYSTRNILLYKNDEIIKRSENNKNLSKLNNNILHNNLNINNNIEMNYPKSKVVNLPNFKLPSYEEMFKKNLKIHVDNTKLV